MKSHMWVKTQEFVLAMRGVAGCGDGLVQEWGMIELSKVRAVTHQ